MLHQLKSLLMFFMEENEFLKKTEIILLSGLLS